MTENEAIETLKRDLGIQIKNKCLPDGIEALEIAIKSMEELHQYHTIGTVEYFQESADVRNRVTEIVNRQLIGGKNNFKETYDCFHDIVKVVQDNY